MHHGPSELFAVIVEVSASAVQREHNFQQSGVTLHSCTDEIKRSSDARLYREMEADECVADVDGRSS